MLLVTLSFQGAAWLLIWIFLRQHQMDWRDAFGLRDLIADETREREPRFASGRDVIVLLSDMTGNRVWQMLARRTRAFLASEPLREARRRLRRDPGRVVPIVDACLAAVDAGRPNEAIAALRRLISHVGDTEFSPTPTPARAQARAHGGV